MNPTMILLTLGDVVPKNRTEMWLSSGSKGRAIQKHKIKITCGIIKNNFKNTLIRE